MALRRLAFGSAGFGPLRAALHAALGQTTRARSPRLARWNRHIPILEWLEDRTLFSASPLDMAVPLDFNAFQAAHVSHLLARANEVDLYRVALNRGDTLDARVGALSAGGGLASLLRVVNFQGVPLALDNPDGGDPHLRFEAATAGVYFIGVSSAPNSAYIPTVAGSAIPGATRGLYTLDVHLTLSAPLLPELTDASIRLGRDTAVPGDFVPVQFTVENRGAADPGNFQVQVLLAGSERFDNSAVVARTLTRADLTADATGRSFAAPAGFAVTVPPGQATGPLFVGLRIIPDPGVVQSDPFGNSAARRGVNFESLAVLTPVPAGVTDLPVNAGADGTLGNAAEVSSYSFTVTSALGMGQLQIGVVTTSGSLVPRLTLARSDGSVLIQSDSGQIVQHLQPGTFVLRVSAQAGQGSYRLSTQFAPTQDPFKPPVVGKRPTIAIADVNGDGFQDLITANYVDNTVSVCLGAGDGSFGAPIKYSVGTGPLGVAVADLNGDGIPDIVTANYLGANVSVLLGKGDGTFNPATPFDTGSGPLFPVIADVNGDGKPDIITGNYTAGSVSVLLGNGDGTFQPHSDTSVGANAYPGFIAVADVTGDGIPDIISPNSNYNNLSVLQGDGNGTFQPRPVIAAGALPFAVQVADLNGDGIPDLVSANRNPDALSADQIDGTVRVRLGTGHGTFGPETIYTVGREPYAMVVADVNGDGRPDVAVTNRGDGTVSVLLDKADGTLQPQETFPVGQRPLSLQIADVNRDGKPDIVAANADDNTVSVLLGLGDGSFSFPAGTAAGKRPFLFAVGDLNGDGIPDMVTANSAAGSVSVLLGAAGGSFQPHQTFHVGTQPVGVALADLNGDHILDMVVTNKADNTVSVLLGNGDGSFGPQTTFAAGLKPLYVVIADLNCDGFPDIIVTNNTGGTLTVLLGHGNGLFDTPAEAQARGLSSQQVPTGATTYGVAVADVNGDGIPDIIASNYGAGSISVLLGHDNGSGKGDGTFLDNHQPVLDNVGKLPAALALGDVNGDGILDIVVALRGENKVAVLLGNNDGHSHGDGTFAAPQTFATGGAPTGVALADFNHDTFLDVVVSNRADDTVSVRLGNGAGDFGTYPTLTLPVGRQPFSAAATDVSGDGIPDIITANASGSTVSVLVSNGNGTFQPQAPFALGKRPYAVVVADVSGDGNPDTITANYNKGTVSVRRGNGNGSFQSPQTFAVGDLTGQGRPLALALADLNHDGRSDLVTANSADNTVSVLLGNGDGTFQTQQTIPVGQRPSAVAVADVNGDGNLDLVVSNYADDTVSVLLGRGDGSFRDQQTFRVGHGPNALTAADLNGDHKFDLIVTNIFDNTVSVLLGNGNGTFQPQQAFGVGAQPYDVAVADVNGDGKPDLIAANYGGNSVSVLLGDGAGSFGPQQPVPVGERPVAVAVADVNGDRRPDLVSTNRRDGTLSILLNQGAGVFTPGQTLDAGVQPVSTAVANVNGDGRPNIVTVNYSNSTPRVVLASTGFLKPTTPGSATEGLNNTALVDLNHDGVPDSVILDASGHVLFRQGLAGAGDAFVPPVVLNPSRRARDMTIVNTGVGLSVATADSSFDPALSAAANQFLYTVSLFTFASGSFTRTTAFNSPLLPTRIVAGDLTGDGLDDIVVANALDNSIQVSFQGPHRSFSAPLTLSTGEAPSNLVLADVNGDGLPDIVATDQASGDVTVFLNDDAHAFSTSLRLRAGPGRFGLDTSGPAPVVAGLQQSVSLVAGDFTGNGRNDLVVVNRAAHSFSVLPNDGRGGFANPRLDLTTSTSDGFTINNQPGAIVAGDFNRDGHLDLAVLMEDAGQLWIYTGTGHGAFRHTFSIAVGDQATGLTVVPGTQLGAPDLLDLLVGNGFGDILHLEGKGDGTFQISGKRVSLSVVPDLLGPGQAGVLVGNQQDNRVTIQAPNSGGTQFAPVQTLGGAAPSSQLAPGDVQSFKLDRDSILPDAVVVSSGSNAVVVYRTTAISNGVPVFAPQPQTYFVGTAPASVTVADINGDGIADMLIANRGSNNVSVLFGSYDLAGHWQGLLGPRLKSGGDGPIAVAVRDLNGDGVMDLVVTNGGSGTLTMLPGVGQGFFDDRNPRTLLNLGSALVASPTFVGNSGLGYAVTAAGELVRFDLGNLGGGAGVVFAGAHVLAAQALDSGLVVVVVADGTVKILQPDGDHLSVAAELRANAGVPALPSALEVLTKPDGKLEVLVSSQGSDTIFVFASASTAAAAGPLPGGGGPLSPVAPPQFIDASTNGSATSSLGSAGGDASGASGASSTGSASGSASASASAGGSLSGFVSEDTSARSSATAVLVALQGNTYSTVPVLDFASQHEDNPEIGGERMPWRSTSRPMGDASPLMRFVIGQEEALRQYRGTAEGGREDDSPDPLRDPWRENLFQRRPSQPLPAPEGAPGTGQPPPEAEAGEPTAFIDPEVLSFVFAGMLLPPMLWPEAPGRAAEEQSERPAGGSVR